MKTPKSSRILRTSASYVGLALFGFLMVFPIIWIVSASLKPNINEIFGTLSLIPSTPDWGTYARGWTGIGQLSFGRFFLNSGLLTVPTVLATVFSSVIVGYGFARFRFPGKKVFFLVMISSIMIPQTVLLVPRYILFRDFGWLDSYLPFIIPALFGTFPFFNFLMIQFFRGIPRELDESAHIDGAGSLSILTRILLPLSRSAIFAVIIFQFVWIWNDFLNQLVFINSMTKYTLSLGLRMTIDIDALPRWNEIMAMSVVAMIPPILLFFLTQKYFVEGVARTGLKG